MPHPHAMHPTALHSAALRVQAEQIADAYAPNGGRPAMISDANTVQVFLAAIADGNYRETACKVAGIAKQTFYNTLKRAEAGDEAAIAFVDALEKAEGFAESETVRNVRQASKLPQFWAAGMTWLERKSPERWGKREGDTSGPRIVVQIGVNASQVQGLAINVVSPPPFAPDCLESAQRNSLETHAFALPSSLINSDYGNQPAALIESQIPAHECQGAPGRVGGASLAVGEGGGAKGLAGAEDEKRP